jgi:hypothetical protein
VSTPVWPVLLLLALCTSWTAPACAHKSSDSYLRLEAQGRQVDGQWDVALRDLDFALGLDEDQDGAITWGEVRARHAQISAYALSRLRIQGDGRDCPLAERAMLVDHHTDGAYAVLRFAADCAQAPTELRIDYALMFDLDAQHRGLLQFAAHRSTSAHVFSPERARQRFALREPGASWSGVLDYVEHGTWHIWRGLDHMLFLLSLLAPAVLVREGRTWRPAPAAGTVWTDTVKVVTAFTAGHAITLTLSALTSIQVPARWGESAIAASVLLAALNNVWPLVNGRRWLLAGVFGLVHGLGFAAVLHDMQLPRDVLLAALLGFNIGVELAQLAVVAALLPLAWWWRSRPAYRVGLVTAGSLAIAGIATAWLVERALNLRVLS